MEQNSSGGIRGARGGRSIAFPPLENSIPTTITPLLPLPHKGTRRYLHHCCNCPHVKSLLSFTFNSLSLSLSFKVLRHQFACCEVWRKDQSGGDHSNHRTVSSTAPRQRQGSDLQQVSHCWSQPCIARFFTLVISNYIEAIRQFTTQLS